MTPIWCCGLECGLIGSAVVDAGHHWRQVSDAVTAATIETTIVRSGARAIRFAATADSCRVQSHVGSASLRHVGRCYLRFETFPDTDVILIMTGTATTGAQVGFNSSESKLYAAVGGVNGASGVSVSTGQWYRVDFDLNTTAGDDTADAQVDGVACGQATGAGQSAVARTLTIGFNSSVTGDLIIDDLVTSGTAADYPIGPGFVHHFVPTADGAHNVAGANDFEFTLTGTDITNATTTANTLVNKVPLEATMATWINMLAPLNATDYVECIFGPASGIPAPTFPPRAVEVICGINQAGTGLGNMEIRLNDNGTTNAVYTATGVAGFAVATGVRFKRKHYTAGPAGAWVIGGGGNGDFTDLRIQFGSPAALDVNPDQYFGSAMIEAEFEHIKLNKPLHIRHALQRASHY